LRTGPSYSEESNPVLYVVIAMAFILVVAALVVVYVAYPHRGETMPHTPWLGEALGKAADRVPVIEEDEYDVLRLTEHHRR
jgi:hypothetical protein